MKTFEEYHFKIKHTAITSSNVNEEKKLLDLEVGDWFYYINIENYWHIQISNKKDDKEKITLLFTDERNEENQFIVPKGLWFGNNYWIDDCTIRDKDAWIITTNEEYAKYCHKEYCATCKMKEFPIKF